MKLSELVTHTSFQLGVDRTIVESHSRYLREALILTSSGRGLSGAEMKTSDCASLFVAVCGVGVASRAGHELPKWRERVPGLFEYIERRVSDSAGIGAQFVFFVDRYSAIKINTKRTERFGSTVDARSYLSRTVTATAFQDWIEGVRG